MNQFADTGWAGGPVRRRWLWIAGELSHELTTGLLVYSANLARSVAAQGVDITMVGLADAIERGVNVQPQLVMVGPGRLRTIPVAGRRRSGLRSVLSSLPNLTYSVAGAEIRDAVTDLLGRRWDVIVIDHLQAAWVLPLVAARHDGVVVFVTHNHEGSMRSDIAAHAPRWNGRRWLLGRDARKAGRLERAALRSAHVVTAITDADAARFSADIGGLDCLVLSPGWSGPSAATTTAADIPSGDTVVRPIGDRPRRVGMLGSFEWHAKQENLRRFVAAADPVFAAAGVELVVGGRVDPGLARELARTSRATKLVGWVPDMVEFFADVRVGVVSEPLGGGFKLKTLDYVFNRVPLATLSSSRAGIPVVPGESVIDGATEAELAAAIVASIDDADRLAALAAAAHAACAPAFEWFDRGDALVRRVDAIPLR